MPALFSASGIKSVAGLFHNTSHSQVTDPSLAEHDMPCLSKQYRSRSVGF